MAGTKIQSTRSSIIAEGTAQYEIVSTCTNRGTLPDTNLFLLSTPIPEDPKGDTLLRVVTFADIPTYSTDRDAVVASGVNIWRSTEVTLVFDDIETANAGQKELSSRINSLVQLFDTTAQEFESINELVTYPITDPGVEAALIASYASARTAADDKEIERDAAQLVCTDLEEELTVIEERLAEAETDFTTLSSARAKLDVVNTSIPIHTAVIQTQLESGATFLAGSTASAQDQIALNVFYVNIGSRTTLITNLATDLGTAINAGANSIVSFIAGLTARISSLTTDKNQKLLELSTCNSDLSKLQGQLTAARATEDEALAAVTAVCTDFDPNSV